MIINFHLCAHENGSARLGIFLLFASYVYLAKDGTGREYSLPKATLFSIILFALRGQKIREWDDKFHEGHKRNAV